MSVHSHLPVYLVLWSGVFPAENAANIFVYSKTKRLQSLPIHVTFAIIDLALLGTIRIACFETPLSLYFVSFRLSYRERKAIEDTASLELMICPVEDFILLILGPKAEVKSFLVFFCPFIEI